MRDRRGAPKRGRQRLTRVPFAQYLTHTDDRFQSAVDRRSRFLLNRFVGLPEVLTALGVTDNGKRAAGVAQHGNRHLAGEGPLRFPVNILRSDANRRSFS